MLQSLLELINFENYNGIKRDFIGLEGPEFTGAVDGGRNSLCFYGPGNNVI